MEYTNRRAGNTERGLGNYAINLFDEGIGSVKKTIRKAACTAAIAGMLLPGCATLTPTEITTRYGEPVKGSPGEYIVRRPSKVLPVGFLSWYVVSWVDGGRAYYWFGKHPVIEGGVNAGIIIGAEEFGRAKYQDRHPRTGRGPLEPIGPLRDGGDAGDPNQSLGGPSRDGGSVGGGGSNGGSGDAGDPP